MTTSRLKSAEWIGLGVCLVTQLAWSQSRSVVPALNEGVPFASASARHSDISERWVVLADSVTVRRAPNSSTRGFARLLRGDEILVAARDRDWLAVSIPADGTLGWIPSGTVERVDVVAAGAVAFIERLRQHSGLPTSPELRGDVEATGSEEGVVGDEQLTVYQSRLVEDGPAPEEIATASSDDVAQDGGDESPPGRRDSQGASMSYMRSLALPMWALF